MARAAGLNVARMKAPAHAAVLALLLGLAACGGDTPGAEVAPAQENGLQQASRGSSATTGAQDPVGAAPAGAPAGSLDTSTWVLAPPFYAAGDEPFWRMEIVDGWFSFRRSGLRAIDEPLVQPRKEAGADVFETGSLRVTIRREGCSTVQGGAGDFSARVSFDGLDYDGCAFSGQMAVVASAEAATAAESLTPIDACLAKLGQPALATAVYPRQDGEQIAVALRAKNGASYECVTAGGGADVVSLDPLDQGSQPAWMNRMRFLREGVTAPACADIEEVRVGEQVVGRLLGKACKF